MSVEFRQRSVGEFIQMLKRRKWLILLPVITMTASIGYVVYKLPSVYESRTVLTVKPPTISETVVNSLSETDISQRIETINTRVLSRTSLEPMIAKYKLFELERSAGIPTEIMVDRMRRNISVELVKTDRDKLASFEISYRDRTPESARNVAAELASKYVSAQITESTERAKDTQEFIDNELASKKKILDDLADRRLGIMIQNVETLPESAQGLIAQLEGLRQREQNIGKEKETLIMERGRVQDSIRALNAQMRLIEDFGVKEIKEAGEMGADIENTIPYGQMVQRRAALNATLANLKLSLKDKHPKVIEAKNDIAKIEEEIANLRKNSAKRAADATRRSTRNAELRRENLLIERQRAENQITQIDRQITAKDDDLRQNGGLISVLETKINAIPNVKVALESVETQYQSAKKAFDDLEKKRNDASLQVNRESKAQGETISVIDPANLPKSPVAPKREVLTAFGGALGLMIGLLLAAIYEVPRLFKIHNINDAKHYTGLPVLASVPPLLTPNEVAWNKRSYWFKVLAGTTAAIGSIPILIMVIQATRVFDSVVS